MDYKFIPDYFIPEGLRGKTLDLPKGQEKQLQATITLDIPSEAHYLDINPLEEENEFLGEQGFSNKIQLIYYSQNKSPIKTDNLFGEIICQNLMSRLEIILTYQRD